MGQNGEQQENGARGKGGEGGVPIPTKSYYGF